MDRRASAPPARQTMRRPEVQSFADLERWLDEHGVTEVECLVPDLTGVARGKILPRERDRKSTRLNSSHRCISYAVFCLKKKKNKDVGCARGDSTHRVSARR